MELQVSSHVSVREEASRVWNGVQFRKVTPRGQWDTEHPPRIRVSRTPWVDSVCCVLWLPGHSGGGTAEGGRGSLSFLLPTTQ